MTLVMTAPFFASLSGHGLSDYNVLYMTLIPVMFACGLQTPPEFAQSCLSRSKRQIKHTQICSLRLCNACHMGTNAPLDGDDCRLTYSNWAVQSRVGLELGSAC